MPSWFEDEPGTNGLAELADQRAGAPALERALSDAAAELLLSPDLRVLLEGLGEAGNYSVGEFLRSRDLHGGIDQRGRMLRRAFEHWLSRQQANPPAKPPAAPPSLRELLDKTRVPDIGEWPLSALGGAGVYGGSMPIGELVRGGGWRREEAARARKALVQLQADLDRLRAEGRLLPPLCDRAPATGNDALARVRRAAALTRQPTLDTWPQRLFAVPLRFVRSQERLRAEVRLRGAYEAATVTLPPLPGWRGREPLGCSCRLPECVHRALALDALLEQLDRPDPALVELALLALQPRWMRALEEYAAAEEAPRDQPGSLSFTFAGDHPLEIRLHAIGKRGKARGGRLVHDAAEVIRRVEGLDRRIAELLALADTESAYRPHQSSFFGDALLLLAGHPDVRWAGRGPLPVETASARVVAGETGSGLRFQVFAGGDELRDPEPSGYRCSGGLLLPRLEGDRILLVKVPDAALRFLATLRDHGAEFPREALPALAALLPRLEAALPVELPEELRGEERPTGNRPTLRVEQRGEGLLLALRIEPLPLGPLFTPGQGVPMAVALEGHKRTFARRDFERELIEAGAAAGLLGLDLAAATEPYTWHLDRADRHVETLRRIAQSGLPVEWKAPRPRFTSEARVDRLRLSVRKKRDWFGLEGEVEVDGQRVALAALLEAARLRRRWVKLGEGDYAQLSEQLIDRLAPLAHLAEGEGALTLTPGTVPLVEALAPQVLELEAAEGWRRMSEKMASAQTLEIEVPAGLTATLRDYQADGFRWLSRLAHWGAGAVLADDMGLGKTIEALALLVSRAPLGPSLVVAPASVLHTWRAEAARFATALRLHLFHEGDRDLSGLQESDVVVVSWGLLAREAELFAGTRFATAVLDEAHAIKNASTKRARAAHGLQADFVVALSGTPVENHLGELWSLFRAALPSLLGSEESFRRRYGGADQASVRALAALLQPFILRRTKGQVARELPARTDINLLVPLSDPEKLLYEDLRLAAAANLGEVTADDQRFQVLAALTRLRLAACHPRLVQPGWDGPASKLHRLLELSRELLAAGHRALVFSQFTSHLSLVAEALREEGIAFSYLDGQVPLAERQRRVEAFQAGDGGDLFLISLKAGGTGLTLTAADYVVHLDPWWNPAVEDQASDRAHRIGQARPVTVYRLIAQGTIEEQILSLHREKRELVDAFLTGADVAARLSTTQLAALIRGGSAGD